MELFKITRRFTGAVLFELECRSLKLAVEAAVKSGAYLSGANLGGAYQGDFKIDGEVGIIDAGMPNHWYAFGYVDTESQFLRVRVGCRHIEINEGRAYWSSTDHPQAKNRREVLAALDYIEAVARLRGWTGDRSGNLRRFLNLAFWLKLQRRCIIA